MKTKYAKTPFIAAFSVGAVLFSAHAGGGFATGNQANTYYVGLGWAGVVSAIAAMLLLTLTMREAMIMYNSRGLTGHKQLFETLYHPFDKLVWLFEIFFYIMVLMAVAAAISGAASALTTYFGMNYYIGVVAVGALVLVLTIFGAGIVRAASTYMGIAILITAITIYAVGIFNSERTIMDVLAADFETTGFADVPTAILNACPRRVRPVLMTALTTILGLVPMVFAGGEGSEMMRPMGIVMMTGMVISTIATLFITPVYYSITDSVVEAVKKRFKRTKKESRWRKKLKNGEE